MASPPTPLRAPEHQVAGHQAAEGRLGPLVDGAGLFFKPLQGDGRGDDEVSFYTLLSSLPSSSLPSSSSFFPSFHGTRLLPASDGSGPHPHLALEDLVAEFSNPAIVDIKIGSRTWYPQASEDYIRKCFEKDQRTTSASLGSGSRDPDPGRIGAWKPDRARSGGSRRGTCGSLCGGSCPPIRAPIRRALAAAVYGGADGVLAKLGELKRWFEEQTLFHFNSVSVLVVYERDAGATLGKGKVKVKLVDFAHVVEGKGVIDHNFLGGLCSLIRFISDVLTGLDENCI
ncbi:Inositol polyphosphate multikinase beta [Ananas comosus]|uniref:Inositol polyphosphate multikinase n=1 Tax=Ananas comosus TaxID=4615 RepID=A0A199UL27_ANACO|nr:Inositol polyphosphate multikinase beta [Ananas comosus]